MKNSPKNVQLNDFKSMSYSYRITAPCVHEMSAEHDIKIFCTISLGKNPIGTERKDLKSCSRRSIYI